MWIIQSIDEAQRRFQNKFPFVKGYLQVSNKSAKKQVGINPVVEKLLEISKVCLKIIIINYIFCEIHLIINNLGR